MGGGGGLGWAGFGAARGGTDGGLPLCVCVCDGYSHVALFFFGPKCAGADGGGRALVLLLLLFVSLPF